MLPKVLILYAQGTNRECETKLAFELAGATVEVISVNQLRTHAKQWDDYQILVMPGGFSYADVLGAGRLFALDLKHYFTEELHKFIESGKPVIGICNGFQALVKAGVLPAMVGMTKNATLTFNQKGQFECRWVNLKPQSQKCLWTYDLEETIYCPVAHGEGRFLLENTSDYQRLQSHDQIALRYIRKEGTQTEYPDNPNGSLENIAGICNPAGNVLGLMPHPENHLFSYQHPRWTRGEKGHLGLPLFKKGVAYVR